MVSHTPNAFEAQFQASSHSFPLIDVLKFTQKLAERKQKDMHRPCKFSKSIILLKILKCWLMNLLYIVNQITNASKSIYYILVNSFTLLFTRNV